MATIFPMMISKSFSSMKIVVFSFKISLKFVPHGPINNWIIPELVQIMAWRQSGNKPLSEPMMAYVADAYMHHSSWMS